ncbi:hypothetical protein HO173_011368 [Letharia columbiana]|uniref:ATP adenylyltransferase C-terminal domain-containing protein n=1 Tax=Letharia columbiana TaxID=112416 RepID=A0A8H6FJI7_9LECA|nr:uncharacterized protein HO173_011368 [Letharia columbiana]KAF6229721.1 hypothetical protein HO173_011368 [Letharia columbiana]
MDSNREIPPELEAIALRKFDSLVDRGEIQYERPKTSVVWAQGFQFQFDVTPALSNKPILSPEDPGRSNPIGPFVDPPEEWPYVETSISGVPFVHFVVRLPEKSSSKQVYTQYERLLGMAKDALKAAHAGTDYNLILVSEWMALIPRRRKGWGSFIANAANMVGSLWLRIEEQRDDMLKHPIVDMLAELGIPLQRT